MIKNRQVARGRQTHFAQNSSVHKVPAGPAGPMLHTHKEVS